MECCRDGLTIVKVVNKSSRDLSWSALPKSWVYCFFFQETIEDIDKNKDGLISLEEYIGKLLN